MVRSAGSDSLRFLMNCIPASSKKAKESCQETVRYIIKRNIIHGDVLSLLDVAHAYAD